MQVRLTLRGPGDVARDVLVDAPAGTRLLDVADRLADALPLARSGPPSFWHGRRQLPTSALVGGPGLRDGDTLHVGAAAPDEDEAAAVLRLHVVCGPDAGTIVALRHGLHTIGRVDGCDVVLTDPDVSRRHASVTVTASGVTVHDLGSTNGTHIDGAEVDADGSPLQPGQLLALGDTRMALVTADEPAAAIRPGPDGRRLVNRPPRLTVAHPGRELTLPSRPSRGRPQPVQWLAAALPAAAGIALAALMHQVIFLVFALMSPVMMLGTAASDRLHWRRSTRRSAAVLRAEESVAEADQARLLADETAQRRQAHPDPAKILRTATIPACRLWERRRHDPDLLELRLGLADCPSMLRVWRDGDVLATAVHDVPVTANLRAGPVGVAGPRGIALGVARWLLGQLVVLHSPADVDIALVLSDDAAPAWRWARWLPHLRGRTGADPDRRQLLVSGLARLADERLADRRAERDGWTGRWTVLLIDRAGDIPDTPGLARLLADGPRVGITAICLDDEPRRLPTSCATVTVACGDTGTKIATQVAGGPAAPLARADRVSAQWAERVARALAPLVDAGGDGSDALPDACRLLDLLDLANASPASIVERWRDAPGPVTPIGIGADGPLLVDLVHDGPHALVAGTTGSGKSELLQSLVAGLAARNDPLAVSFVLIDYKGGAAFAQCAGLPHTAGLVTDLDPHLTRRALRSLDAELHRRERLFAAVGAKDLAAYRATPRQRTDPVGRLILVVDEFAALAEELPEFVTGLIGIAQRGRSLGVHLVLATQRPGGVVSPEIRANTALRIALRVTDANESTDVIGTDAAALIDKQRPGRALVRTGSALTEIQTARVGGAASISGSAVHVLALDRWGRPAEAHPAGFADKTDLALLADTLREAAAVAGVAPVRRPWLPPLPDTVPVATLRDSSLPPYEVPWALADFPDSQSQQRVVCDLAAGGPTLIVGGARSGRSTALRSLVGAAAEALTPHDLHLYVLDCAGGALRRLTELPHCAAVVSRDDPTSMDRLLTRIADEIVRRQSLLVELGAASIADARACGVDLPYLLLVVDGWEGFAAAADDYDSGRMVDALLTMFREAAAAGVSVVVSGDRAALAARVSGAVARKYLLALADRADYALAGVPVRSVPVEMPPGRAIRADDGVEVQFAVLGSAADADEQQRVLAEIAAVAPGGDGPPPLRPLPTRVRLSELVGRHDECVKADQLVVIGAGGDAAEAVALDLFAGDARWLVAGPPRSGRTTSLRLLAQQAVIAGIPLLVAAPRRSALRDDLERCGITVLAPDDPPPALPLSPGRQLVLVDDSELFLDSPVGDALFELARQAPLGLAVVAAGRSDELAVTYRGVAAQVRRSRTGLLLQPTIGDGDLLGIRLPRSRVNAPPGRGVLVADQSALAALSGTGVLPVQVALP